MLEAIKVEGTAFANSSSELREDRDMVLRAAQIGCGSALEGAKASLRADRELVAEAVQLDPAAFKYASEDLRNDYGFALQIVEVRGDALQYMPDKFKADAGIVKAAMANNPSAVAFAHTSRRLDMGLKMPWDSDLEYMPVSKVEIGEDDVAQMTALTRRMELPEKYHPLQLTKLVFFSGMGTISPNIGQANYFAANCILDRITDRPRPTIEATTLMWGGMGQIGMRLKAFGSQDVLNAAPENLLTIYQARQILKMVCGRFDVPDWLSGAAMDENGRGFFLTPTAGFGSGGGWKPSEDAGPLNILRNDIKHAGHIGNGTSEDVPLGGWPTLLATPKTRPKQPSPELPSLPIIEGCRVMLSGLQTKNNKNGSTGIAIKQLQDGKWKVLMDDNSGNALLKEEYLKGIANPQDAAAGAGIAEPKDFEEESTAESEAIQVATEQKKQLMEEKAKLAKERLTEKLAEKHAEKQKHEGIPGVFRAARPGWNDYAIDLSVKAVTKAGADSVAALKAMLEQDENGSVELNRKLVATGNNDFSDDFLDKLREQCAKALAT